jgi:hypothetical protein
MKNLQNALNQSVQNPAPVIDKPIIQNNQAPKAEGKRPPSREGKANVAAWLKADFKSSLRLVQIRKGQGVFIDDLIAEALNDLFRKYDVPTIQHD